MACSMTVTKTLKINGKPHTVKTTCVVDNKVGWGVMTQRANMMAVSEWSAVATMGDYSGVIDVNTFIPDSEMVTSLNTAKVDVCATVEYIGDSQFPKFVTLNCKDIVADSSDYPWNTISYAVKQALNNATGIIDFSVYPVKSATIYVHI